MNYFSKKRLLNHQIFMEKLIADEAFFREILDWHEKLKLVKNDLGVFADATKRMHLEAHELGLDLMQKIIDEKNIEFISWLNTFCAKHQLEEVWKQSLINYIACGYYCPPDTAIKIKTDTERNIVILELEADVDKEDIFNSWPKIKEQLKKLPKKKRRRYSYRSFRNFAKYMIKNMLKIKENLRGMDLIGRVYEDEDDISEEADKKRLRNMKMIAKRIRKRGVIN